MSIKFRPPSVPLVVHDPYFSIWSNHDRLTDGWSVHWTGSENGIAGCAFIDGTGYSFCGKMGGYPTMEQKKLTVYPTRTVYEFEAGMVRLRLTWMTPALPHRPDILSRPVTYVIFEAESLDSKPHNLRIYMDVSGEICVNSLPDHVSVSRFKHGLFELLSIGSVRQEMLAKSGDNLRIDWGFVYLAVPKKYSPETVLGRAYGLRSGFLNTGLISTSDSLERILPAKSGICMAQVLPLNVVPGETCSAHLMIAYDDLRSIEYFERKLPAWWRRNGMEFGEMLEHAENEFPSLFRTCVEYDDELMRDLASVGGEDYAAFASLAFRQAIGAHKLVADFDGSMLFFSKENFSNGCIATVDVTYPSAPLFLMTSPEMLKGMLIPILDYASSSRWKFPFAPHDLGTYPLANGQIYGGGEKSEDNQMPVEECGNMLILAGALLKFTGDVAFIRKYRDVLMRWADYLCEKGFDPENQLCTDDFAGHLAHNTNLSLKAILALGAASQMADALGDKSGSGKYLSLAKEFAARWTRDAFAEDHYLLAFDKPDSWSMKYNLVWDRLLNLNIFPASVAEKEVAFYRDHLNCFGLPLDSRKDYTKLDWQLWCGILTGKRSDFDALFAPVSRWMNETKSRVPLTDWYDTFSGNKIGFQARSVLGGVFIPLLAEKAVREKWLAKTGK